MSQQADRVEFPTTRHIDDLPPELMEHIFSFLPLLCDRKSASLVCKAWLQLAFSYRGMAHVKLHISYWMIERRGLMPLLITTRPYRHLVLSLQSFDWLEEEFPTIVVMLENFGQHVESFFVMDYFCQQHLREFVVRMPNLKQIILGGRITWGHCPVDAEMFPVLPSLAELRIRQNSLDEAWIDVLRMAPNVEKISVVLGKKERSLEVVQRCGRQLKSLELFESYYRVPIENWDLSQLHTLKIHGRIWDQDERLLKVFGGTPELKTVDLRFQVTTPLLKVITENCPQITTLRVNTQYLLGNCLQYLESLIHLKVLYLDGFICPDMVEDCCPLPNIETLCINEIFFLMGTTIEQVKNVFPRVTTFQIDSTYGMMSNELDLFVRLVCSSLVQLKHLRIGTLRMCISGNEQQASPEWLNNIMALPDLEELHLSCFKLFGCSCLYVELSSNWLQAEEDRSKNNIKRLKLSNCYNITIDDLMKLLNLFPEVQFLEISQCKKITEKNLQVIRQRYPNCAVHFSWYYGGYNIKNIEMIQN